MSFPIIWSGNFYHLRHSCSYKLLRFQSGSTPKILPDTRTCNLRFLASKAEGKNQKSQSKKPQNVNVNHNDGSVKSSSSKTINKSELHEFKAVQCYQHISEKRVFDWPAVVIAFDIETTGLSRQKERIIEIALRDLYGGKNSTFQTLVNPEKEVSNSYIHGIRSDMVNRPDVPRRCKVEIPEDWLFVDTLPLARKLVKPDGSKLESSKLDDLRQYYEIPLIGPAHRAMQDVHTLAYVLQKMTYQLKLSIPELLDGGFRASDIIKVAP